MNNKTNYEAINTVQEIVSNSHLNVEHFFSCPVYTIERPDFINDVSKVSEEYLNETRKIKPVDEIYPAVMSNNFAHDNRIASFAEFVGSTAWNILDSQGYAMQDKLVTFTEMWAQEHHKHSAMEQHVHGQGVQIVGFYFLEVPEESSRAVFHDPRAGKVQIDLREADINRVSIASQMINFKPKPGLLIMANAWLAHSFTRHAADKPIKFVHFNLAARYAKPNASACSTAEVI